MYTLKYISRNLCILLGVSLTAISPAAAQSLDASGISFAFGSKASDKSMKPFVLSSARGMTPTEMAETKGAVAPLVAVGVFAAGRFIVQRFVSQRLATSLVRKGGTHLLAANRQQAAAIARSASQGGLRPIREFHAGPGQRFTHFHPNPRIPNTHIFFGRPR